MRSFEHMRSSGFVAKRERKTLLQLQGEVEVKDPSAHAKKQVAELDKTAKTSLSKRKACNDQILTDKKELERLEEQIAQIHRSYDPLCRTLLENKEKKESLVKMLEQCKLEERRMMGSMSQTVMVRKQDDSKLQKKMASQLLERERGFGMGSETTFKQKQR